MEESDYNQNSEYKRYMIFAGIGCLFLAAVIFAVEFNNMLNTPAKIETPDAVEQVVEITEPTRVYNINPQTKESCEMLSDAQERQKCLDEILLGSAIDGNDIDGCNDIIDEDIRWSCMHHVAHNLKDIELCQQIDDAEVRATCLGDIAISLRDPSICTGVFKASFEQKECADVVSAFIIGSSGKKTDIKECANLETKEYSKLCFMYSFTDKYGGDCSQVPAPYRQLCVDLSVSQAPENVSDCDKVKNASYKEYCQKVATLGILEARVIDSDGDSVTDGNELFMNLDPKNSDSDGDGLSDGEEWKIFRTDPGSADSDEDGLNDYDELKIYLSDAKNSDSDGDGISDGNEIKQGSNPLSKG